MPPGPQLLISSLHLYNCRFLHHSALPPAEIDIQLKAGLAYYYQSTDAHTRMRSRSLLEMDKPLTPPHDRLRKNGIDIVDTLHQNENGTQQTSAPSCITILTGYSTVVVGGGFRTIRCPADIGLLAY